jgi:Flp pilus assembly pilin Flp
MIAGGIAVAIVTIVSTLGGYVADLFAQIKF